MTDNHPTDKESGSGSRMSDLGAYIRNQRESAKLSLRNLAKIAGVSNPYLSQIERGLRKPSAEILQAIAKALSISSETLYVKAGILEERPADADLEHAIERDAYLTDAQRNALIEMYRSFRKLNDLEDDDAGRDRSTLRGIIDAMSTGAVDDADVAAASADLAPDDEI